MFNILSHDSISLWLVTLFTLAEYCQGILTQYESYPLFQRQHFILEYIDEQKYIPRSEVSCVKSEHQLLVPSLSGIVSLNASERPRVPKESINSMYPLLPNSQNMSRISFGKKMTTNFNEKINMMVQAKYRKGGK